ncbi:hypothetical protein SAMN04488029_0574 [Reichenbachiella faecimaris]|uniref:Uncharacterized protein n=1 Tax=Reichenbachiella faecimaris TaxID=692418 RepID=A0A1W2G6K1_REIFA|nr:hypothetical protein [Reichenbachiella faecimaris]SMD32231.1 hypothetical protein SAMN04488029_0574 [Reichenbachiella faecimaris]
MIESNVYAKAEPAKVLEKGKIPNDSVHKRKLESFGLGAFRLFVIASLVRFSTGFTPLLLILIGLSMVGGGLSFQKNLIQ